MAWLSSRSEPAVAPEVPHLRQPRTVVLLVHELARRRDCRATPAGARTRLTFVRLFGGCAGTVGRARLCPNCRFESCPIRGTLRGAQSRYATCAFPHPTGAYALSMARAQRIIWLATTPYHTTDAAQEILRQGFRDAEGSYMFRALTLRGVFPAGTPADINDGATGDDVLEVTFPDDVDLSDHAIVDDGRPQ